MSAILTAVESAFVRHLLNVAGEQDLGVNSFALATNAERVTVTPTGLLVGYEDTPTFEVNFYAGQSEEPVKLPAIIVECSTGQRIEDCPNIQTTTVEISLEASADSKNGFDSLAWIDQASRWLHGEISGGWPLERALEIAQPGLVVSYVSTAECARLAEGRRRVHRWSFQVTASL